MDEDTSLRFDPVDLVQMRLLANLPPHKRIRLMLEARELALGLMRGSLRGRYPGLSEKQINQKLLEATCHVLPR
jgi:hypothetical protein